MGRSSTIQVYRNVYSVDSRLIDEQKELHLPTVRACYEGEAAGLGRSRWPTSVISQR